MMEKSCPELLPTRTPFNPDSVFSVRHTAPDETGAGGAVGDALSVGVKLTVGLGASVAVGSLVGVGSGVSLGTMVGAGALAVWTTASTAVWVTFKAAWVSFCAFWVWIAFRVASSSCSWFPAQAVITRVVAMNNTNSFAINFLSIFPSH